MAHLLLTCFLSGWIMSIVIQSLTPDTWKSCLIPPSLILPVFSLSPCAIDSASNFSCFSISINQVYHNLWVPLLQKPHSLHHPLQTPPIYSLCSNQCDFFPKNKNLVMSHCCLNSSLVPHYFYEVGWRGKSHYFSDLWGLTWSDLGRRLAEFHHFKAFNSINSNDTNS